MDFVKIATGLRRFSRRILSKKNNEPSYFGNIPHFGNLPYPDHAYPEPSNTQTTSEDSDSEESPHLDRTESPINLTMPEAAATTAKMPGRNHHSAPKFDGKPMSLSPFLDEVEQLAEASGLSNKQHIEWAPERRKRTLADANFCRHGGLGSFQKRII